MLHTAFPLLHRGLTSGAARAQAATQAVICKDGTPSAATGRGACARHGGVAQWLDGSQ
jgi:hypothetical protein